MIDGLVPFIWEKLTWKWICEWQLVMGEIGQCGLSISVSASQIRACCHLLYCGSALRLWIFHAEHLTPCPERYFKFFSLSETLGLESVTEVWSQSLVPRQRIGFMMHLLMTSGGFFFFTAEPLCPPWLINHWAVDGFVSLLKRSVCGVVLSREMISICSECKLRFDKLWPVAPSDQRGAGMTKPVGVCLD